MSSTVSTVFLVSVALWCLSRIVIFSPALGPDTIQQAFLHPGAQFSRFFFFFL
jgi:hypothetical protein